MAGFHSMAAGRDDTLERRASREGPFSLYPVGGNITCLAGFHLEHSLE